MIFRRSHRILAAYTLVVTLFLLGALVAASGCDGKRTPGYTGPWRGFTSSQTGISFSYPGEWTLCTQDPPLDKYGTLYIASINSFGNNPFWIQPQFPRPNNWFYIKEADIGSLPPSGAYIEMGWLDITKVIFGEFPLVKGKKLKGVPITHEGPITIGTRQYDKYLIEFRTDDTNYFYIFAYFTDDARSTGKAVINRFINNVVVTRK
ncbi:MAG: hypothetical protein ACYC56_11115 [Candidatus Aquicultor sp.]